MLKISKLTKYYGDILGVKDVSLEVKSGEIFGFIGPNGSGKSTTIRCIMNMINKDDGQIFIDDINHFRK
jgi:ABC-2 type transport system ATP-binding protein